MEDKKKSKKTMNQREKTMGHIYVFLFFSVTTIVCILLIFLWNTDFKAFEQKDFVVIKMNRIKDFQQDQNSYRILVDSLYSRINNFQPGIHAKYEEDDIKYLINNLRNVYEHNSWDTRYKVFTHIASFYDMWFTDKKQLWSIRQNIQLFKSNLEECEIGLQKKEEDLRSGNKK